MKDRNKAFTLIELLVVVLIIGILAAVAVPQYRLALEKSRAMQAIVSIKALAEATERYYLENGEYPTNTSIAQSLAEINSALDIAVPENTDFWIRKHYNVYLAAERRLLSPTYVISQTMKHQNHPVWSKRGLSCNAAARTPGNSLAERICKSLCHTDTLVAVWGSGELGCELK